MILAAASMVAILAGDAPYAKPVDLAESYARLPAGARARAGGVPRRA